MLEASIQQAHLFKNLVESMKDLVTDASFDFSEQGLTMQAMDSSHVSLVFMQLLKDGFGQYRCDRPTALGLNLTNLSKILKCAGPEDSLVLKAKEKPDVLTLMVENKTQDKIMDFNMKLMDIEEENLGIPEQEYKCKVVLDSKEFKRIINDLHALGDTCTISCNKEGVRFSVEGDVGQAAITIKRSQTIEEGTEIRLEEPVELTFALRYLKFFAQAAILSEKVSLSMSSDIPLLVQFDLEGQTGYIKYYLAPKIDDDADAQA